MSFINIIKPSWSKILLSIILILIFVPFINHDNGTRCIKAPCPSDTTSSVVEYLFSEYKDIYYINYLNLIIGLIVTYLISSFTNQINYQKIRL